MGTLKHTRARALPKVEPRVKAKPGRGPRFPSSWYHVFPTSGSRKGTFSSFTLPQLAMHLLALRQVRGAEPLVCSHGLESWENEASPLSLSGPVPTSPWPDEPPGGSCTAGTLPHSPSPDLQSAWETREPRCVTLVTASPAFGLAAPAPGWYLGHPGQFQGRQLPAQPLPSGPHLPNPRD